MRDLQIKKNLLKYSQERAYKASLIQINALGSGLQLLGAYNAGGVYFGVTEIISNLQIRMNDMKNANDMILSEVYSLDKEFQTELFQQDVGMIGTYLDGNTNITRKVTTFQAVEEMVNSVKALKALTNPTSLEGYQKFNFLTVNIMNDFSFKNNAITDLFIRSVDKQKKSYKTTIDLCLILTPLLLGAIGTILIVIIWNQYRIEKKNLKAFIKISPNGVKEVSIRLIKFRKNLANEESFESKWFNDKNNEFETIPEIEQSSTYSKKHNAQIVKYEEFRKRYVNYIFKIFFYITALIGISIWDIVSTQKAIKVIYNRQAQLQFANYITIRVTNIAASYSIMYATNDTMKVEHKKASKIMSDGVFELQAIQSQIISRFLEIDGTYNPDVKKIIFDNNPNCEGFLPDNILFCIGLRAKGQPVNMLVANSAFEQVIQKKYKDYVNADKSTMPKILAVAYAGADALLPNFAVVAHEGKLISDIMDVTLDEKIAENRKARNIIMVVFSISLVIVSILIWIDILIVIRDVYNDFKNVMQIFPPNIVLSSYLLKRFLRKTANRPLFN